jgi:type IV secretory pathway TrbD component
MMIKHVYKIEVKSTQSQESTELAQNAGVNIRYNLTLEGLMGTADIPAMLIVLLLAAALAWGVYNWTHPGPHSPK